MKLLRAECTKWKKITSYLKLYIENVILKRFSYSALKENFSSRCNYKST